MADPCYLRIDDALITTKSNDFGDSCVYLCHACGATLLTISRVQIMTMVPSYIFHKSRQAMKLHLGYPPADHFEAMGL